jgi:hypothetical protein
MLEAATVVEATVVEATVVEASVPEIRLIGPSPVRCPWCHDELAVATGEWLACGSCLARHHPDCWAEATACASCREPTPLAAPRPLRIVSVRAPAGDVEKRIVRRAKMRRRFFMLGASLVIGLVLEAFVATVIVFAEGSAIAPFIYSTF